MSSSLWILDKWLSTVCNPNFNIVQSMHDKVQNLLELKFDEEKSVQLLCEEQPIIEEFLETRQATGILSNGEIFEAKFFDQERHDVQGRACLVWTREASRLLIKLEGFFHQNKLVGNVARTTIADGKITSTEMFYCKKGVLHGFYRKSGCDGLLEDFGVYINGAKEGTWWKGLKGGSFFISQKGSIREEENSIFLFPDLMTSLVGQFCESFDGQITMAKSTPRIISKLQISSLGILTVGYDKSEIETQTFWTEQGDLMCICERPLVSDPYESRYVEVGQSLIPNAGEGLFAKTDIQTGKVVAYFNGVVKDIRDQELDSSDYSISCSGPDQTVRTILDIPDRCRSTDVYCATLAHKICHSFTPNASYSNAFHPRFGHIKCVVSLRKISAGEEICCDYKYSLSKAPDWYLQSLKNHLTNDVGLSEHLIYF